MKSRELGLHCKELIRYEMLFLVVRPTNSLGKLGMKFTNPYF